MSPSYISLELNDAEFFPTQCGRCHAPVWLLRVWRSKGRRTAPGLVVERIDGEPTDGSQDRPHRFRKHACGPLDRAYNAMISNRTPTGGGNGAGERGEVRRGR